jgi:hypothetical protein
MECPKMLDDNADFLIIEREYEAALIERYLGNEIPFKDLMSLLGFSRSHLRRKIACYRKQGPAGLSRKKRIGASNQMPADFRSEILSLVKEHYIDFTPKFAAEKLLQRHELAVKASTLRRWMMEDGIWKTRFERQPKVHSLRPRRERIGELIQVDGSYHRWFEKRGGEACLLTFIDDATGEIMHMRFVDNESSFNYMRSLKWYIDQYGRPLALYSDKYGVFRSPHPDKNGVRHPTMFAQAANGLGIAIICAETPQAKGRVERSFRTSQDRLIKELRLANISTVEEANWFLEGYRQEHNAQFAVAPKDEEDAHRSTGNFDTRRLLTYSVWRKVFKDLSVSFNKIRYILENTTDARRTIGKRVSVVVFLDGTVEIFDEENSLAYRTFDKLTQTREPQIVDRKRLGSAMQMAQAITSVEPHHFKRNNHIMAGFQDFFPQPTDNVSVALQNATKTIRRRHNGRFRGKLHQHPIVILSQTLEPKRQE